MSSDKAAASKQTTGDGTVGSGVSHGGISDPNTKWTGDGADTKKKVPSDHPDGESGASSSGEEGDHDTAASEHYHPRGPPNKPVHGGPSKPSGTSKPGIKR